MHVDWNLDEPCGEWRAAALRNSAIYDVRADHGGCDYRRGRDAVSFFDHTRAFFDTAADDIRRGAGRCCAIRKSNERGRGTGDGGTGSGGIDSITPTGIRANGEDHDVDSIVFATGFDAMTLETDETFVFVRRAGSGKRNSVSECIGVWSAITVPVCGGSGGTVKDFVVQSICPVQAGGPGAGTALPRGRSAPSFRDLSRGSRGEGRCSTSWPAGSTQR